LDNSLSLSTNATSVISASILLSEAVFYPLLLEYSALTSDPSTLGLEILQLSGNFGATACQIRPSQLFGSVASRTRFISVAPARTCCAASIMQSVGSPLSIATAGIMKLFSISLRDAFGNSVNTCSEDVSIVYAGGPAQSRMDCRTSTAEFHPTASGVYLVIAKIKSSTDCALTQVRMIVQPFVRNFEESFVRGTALTLATCGQASWLTITIRDMFGNLQPKSESPSVRCSLNGTFAIQTNISPCPGVNCPESLASTFGLRQYSKSEYVFNYVATLAGNFRLSIQSGDSAQVMGSPFSIRVIPSPVCLAVSFAAGSSLTIVTNSALVSFYISSRDSFGNSQANALWVSVVDSAVVKQSVFAEHVSNGNFRASNRAFFASSGCKIFSMLLRSEPIYAT
jgi:hypothetical protein